MVFRSDPKETSGCHGLLGITERVENIVSNGAVTDETPMLLWMLLCTHSNRSGSD